MEVKEKLEAIPELDKEMKAGAYLQPFEVQLFQGYTMKSY